MKIRNICDGCAGFIGKDGYCAYCGCYYPAFDFSNNQEIEVDETPISVNDEVFDCVLISDGKRICPITLCNVNVLKKIKELIDKGVSDLSVQFVGEENCSFDFKGYITSFNIDAISVDSVSTASIEIVSVSPITSKGSAH